MRIPKRQMQPFTNRWAVGHPPAWLILIAFNVGFFVSQTLMNVTEPHWIERWLALSDAGVKQDFFWQFITYTFLHGNWMHLVTNMLLLYFAGREVEALLGVRHFLAIYFGGGLLGGLVQWSLHLPGMLMGASACVLAVLIAFTTILPELEITALLFFVIPVKIKTKHLAWAVVGMSLLCLVIPYAANHLDLRLLDRVSSWISGSSAYIVAHQAHLAGCLFGWAYVKQLGYGNPLRIQKYFFEKRQREDRRKYMSSEQFITQEIDPILEKISRDGIGSLSRSERRVLEMGREKIEKGRR